MKKNFLLFFAILFPCLIWGEKNVSVPCKVLELIVRDMEKEGLVKKTYSYKDSISQSTGELYRTVSQIQIDTIPEKLRIKRNKLILLDDFVFFEDGICSGVRVFNNTKLTASNFKDKIICRLSGITTYQDCLVITIVNFSSHIKSSYFILIKNDDIKLLKRKDDSNSE